MQPTLAFSFFLLWVARRQPLGHVASNATTRSQFSSDRMLARRAAWKHVSIVFNALPSFFPGPLVDATNRPRTRFHLSVLSRMSTLHATQSFSGFACRHGEQSELTFPYFFLEALVHVASNPTTRLWRFFFFFALQHGDQRERALTFFS